MSVQTLTRPTSQATATTVTIYDGGDFEFRVKVDGDMVTVTERSGNHSHWRKVREQSRRWWHRGGTAWIQRGKTITIWDGSGTSFRVRIDGSSIAVSRKNHPNPYFTPANLNWQRVEKRDPQFRTGCSGRADWTSRTAA